MDISKSQSDLNNSTAKEVQIGYEDLKNKLKILEADNQKMNEQLFSLQNKFYVQTKILNDKNTELSKEVSEKQKMKVEHDKITNESVELKKQIELISKEKEELINQNERYKKDITDLNQKYNESNLKSKYLISQLEEQNSLLTSENNNLKDNSVKLQSKIEYIYNENKAKESKLLFSIKNENKEIIINLRKELSALQKHNDEIIQENIKMKNLLEKNKKEKENLDSTVNTSYMGGNIAENKSMIMLNMENNIKNLKDDINNYKQKIKELEENEIINDKKLKAMKLDLKQSESDIKNYLVQLEQKNNEIFDLEQKIKELIPLIEKSKSIDNMSVEINEKNKTINFLLSQLEDFKNNFNIKSQNFENEINNVKNEKNILEQKLEENKADTGKKIDEYQSKLNDIQSENNILINDLNKKEEEYSKLLEDKIELENKCNIQFEEQEKKFAEIQNNVEELNKENEDLKNKLAESVDISSNQLKLLNDSVIKSSIKMESLMNVYNDHIIILKQRFESILNDMNILVGIQGNDPKILDEKFDKIIKSINSKIDLINKYAESEALIKNFKTDVKNLKNNLESAKNKIKNLEQENDELNKMLNIQKLRMKIKVNEEQDDKIIIAYDKLVNVMKDYLTITQLNIQNSNLFSENEKQKAEIKYLIENNSILTERHANLEKLINDLKAELETKSNTLNKDNKYHKNQIKTLMDQLTRIKETWTPYEKKMEYINHIEDLEKNIKDLKNEINRKKELINTLKNQIEEKQQKISKYDSELNSDTNSVMSSNNSLINANNKEIQNLKSDNLKKLKEIKELKKSIEKLSNDKQNLIEKNKVNKIDINRKDSIINDLKIKINNLKNDNDKLNIDTNDEQQKMIEELKKKEKAILLMKKNIENMKKEIQIYQEENNERIKNNELIKSNEIMSKEIIIENKQMLINKMSACLKLILKDLSKRYATEKNKINLKNINNSVKEEMAKLGLDEENVGDFLGKDENINKTSEQIDLLLNDLNKFSTEKAFKLYNTLLENLKELENENINNDELSFNNFKRSGNSNNIFGSSGGTDNNFLSGKFSGINNFVRGKNDGNKKFLIESN